MVPAKPVLPDWYPLPCTDSKCRASHRFLEDGNRFHPGVYIKIKDWDASETCRTKFKDSKEIIALPQSVSKRSAPGALDVRTFILYPYSKPQFYDYSTEIFPKLVKLLKEANQKYSETKAQIEEKLPDCLPKVIKSMIANYSSPLDLFEEEIHQELDKVLADATELEEMSKGI